MKKILAVFLVILLCSAESFAQTTVIAVDESISRNSSKSLPIAIGASVLLPGLGQQYLGEGSYAKVYMWTDVALWVATFGSYFFGERQIASARSYASRYAGISNPPSDESFLNLMADYRSRGGVEGENAVLGINEHGFPIQLDSSAHGSVAVELLVFVVQAFKYVLVKPDQSFLLHFCQFPRHGTAIGAEVCSHFRAGEGDFKCGVSRLL